MVNVRRNISTFVFGTLQVGGVLFATRRYDIVTTAGVARNWNLHVTNITCTTAAAGVANNWNLHVRNVIGPTAATRVFNIEKNRMLRYIFYSKTQASKYKLSSSLSLAYVIGQLEVIYILRYIGYKNVPIAFANIRWLVIYRSKRANCSDVSYRLFLSESCVNL